jgi:hypothetical protein
MQNTTLKDLVLNAQAAANEAASASDQLGRDAVALAKFNESGFDRADYPTWMNAFNTQLQIHDAFAKQDSPATAAAKKAAAASAKA